MAVVVLIGIFVIMTVLCVILFRWRVSTGILWKISAPLKNSHQQKEKKYSKSFCVLSTKKTLVNKNLVLSDIRSYEHAKGGKFASFGSIFVHTAKTAGVNGFCMSGGIFGSKIELLILWDEISEHRLTKLSEIANSLSKFEESEKSLEEIISFLKKI